MTANATHPRRAERDPRQEVPRFQVTLTIAAPGEVDLHASGNRLRIEQQVRALAGGIIPRQGLTVAAAGVSTDPPADEPGPVQNLTAIVNLELRESM